ncbi:MAG TPA: TetR/AcrR family transcriptional regulator [Bryobacteraceae bacterium]|nr:TetR/AcrR family transcriptional regulator [Bryobacteraceae bacterium]
MATRISAPQGKMRKEPRQERSRDTVEAILQATAHILARRGWAGLSTNEVARVAGVSIGSLYQYFPNKLALIEAVRRRHFDEILSVLRAANDAGESRAQSIEAVVQGMIGLHARNPATQNVLLEEAPRSRESKAAHDGFEAEYLRLYEGLIAGGEPASTSGAMAAQVLSSAIAGVIHDAARRGALTSPILKQELVRLVSAYLSKSRRGRRRM